MRVSKMAENLIGSEIIRLAGEINTQIQAGKKIYNYTIGDFDPKIFPIPTELTELIQTGYQKGMTNYPPANGLLELRAAISVFLQKYQQISVDKADILVAGGARPLIYALYQTILDEGDKVWFPVPSWNNNHYTHLADAQQVLVETLPADNFMPTAALLAPYIKEVVLVSLCSPLNPTGTVFGAQQLREICELIVSENARRGADEKPVYLMYDQIYWVLTYGDTEHVHPLALCPEIAPYVVYIDGLSKSFAATGVRVGWAFGAKHILAKMQSILGHVGAWSPKAEQWATAQYLGQTKQVDTFLSGFKQAIFERLDALYKGFQTLQQKGYAVEVIAPQAAIYLTARFNLVGKTAPNGQKLERVSDITAYLLEQVGLAIVPFSAFGASADSSWYRISVGTCTMEEIPQMFAKLEKALPLPV
jgi:aspartate aminotransferase